MNLKNIWDFGRLVWQRNYHEHIIRNEKSLDIIREYVICNPEMWEQDSLFSF
jgi:REP element-mobilizing transposase RayT